MAKRTYSKYGNGQRPTLYGPDWADEDSRKRAKVGVPDDLRVPQVHPKKSNLLKKGLRCGGPTYLPDETIIVDEGRKFSKKTSVFDRVLNSGRYQSAKPNQAEPSGLLVHSSRVNTLEKKSNQSRNHQLLTPPAEAKKAAHQQILASDDHPETPKFVQDASNHLAQHRTQGMKMAKSKQSYVPKVYKTEETKAPRKTITGDRLSRRSKEAAIWQTNQTKSPLLQLPAAVRNRIFGYVLGGYTIKIDYETYRTSYSDGKAKASVPIFKYNSRVYKGRVDAFKLDSPPSQRLSRSFILLNNVCRQLYEETATLPYKLNLIAFGSSMVMFNFLFQEQRLTSRQRDAITQLVLPDEPIARNVLSQLRGLAKFFLMNHADTASRGSYAVHRNAGGAAMLVKT